MDRIPSDSEKGFTQEEKRGPEPSEHPLGGKTEHVDSDGPYTLQLHSRSVENALRRTTSTVVRIVAALFGIWFVWSYTDFHINSIASPATRDRLCNRFGVFGPGCAHYTYLSEYVLDAHAGPQDLSNDSRVMHEIPQYVIDYAPLVHLYSEEKFWPCDMAEHLFHVTPELNYTPINARSRYSNLTNLDQLNEFEGGRHVYLTSDDNVEERPEWLGGQKNIPDDFDEGDEDGDEPSTGGRSGAPSVLVTVNKGNGIVDAFWFYFYSYNLGNVVFNVRFGNHVGDWEHSLIRFQHGKPKVVFFSEHNFGSAYSYGAVEKIGKRPVVYSATGTHAMYAMPGAHPYVLPLGILHDQTDRGPLWDPALNSQMYTYNHHTDTLRASNFTPSAPTQWFYFAGRWGDKFYPLDDDRQYGQVGLYHYVSGPFGPRFKHLGRRKVCQGTYTDPCAIKQWLPPFDVVDEGGDWPEMGDGDDWPEDPEMKPLTE